MNSFKKHLLIVVTFLIVACQFFVLGDMYNVEASTDSFLPAGNWTLLQDSSDEFNGTSLDSNKWTKGIWYDTTTDLAFKDDNIHVENGNLVLSAKKENFNGKLYTAAAVESKFDVPGTASYVEVRAKVLDSRANVLSAIWLQSSPLSKSLNPNPEIDIMETFNYSQMTSTLHTWLQEPSIHLQRGKNAWSTGLNDISQDYHVYGLERKDGRMRFYFDGQLAWEKYSSVDSFVELSRHMVLSLEGHLGKPNENYLPSTYLIDYVRTYYASDFAGIPNDGVYKIVNRHSGQVLTVPNNSLNDTTQLVQDHDQHKESQKWLISKSASNLFTFQNMNSNKVIDLKADTGVTSNGNAITQYAFHGDSNQKWYIVPTDNGYFKILSALSGKSLVVKNASYNANVPIIQWIFEDNSDTNDEWSFVKLDSK